MIRSVAWVVLVVAVFLATTAFVPRTYGYPKLLLYALGFWLMTRYAVRPTIARAATMAAVIVIAFCSATTTVCSSAWAGCSSRH